MKDPATNGDTMTKYGRKICPACDLEVRVENSGVYANHYRVTASGARRLCLASKRPALTAAELPKPKRSLS